MKHNYYSENGSQIKIIHLPGSGLEEHRELAEYNLDRSFNISKDLSIISVMNSQCEKDSFILKQCEFNNIKLLNTASDVIFWNNPIKIEHILECLRKVTTKYALILDGRDTVITGDLDDSFIEKYLAFDTPIVFNGTPVAYPSSPIIESLQEIIKIKGKQKYLNAGVCIGDKDSLISFYIKAQEIKNNMFNNNNSEQYLIRLTKKRNPKLATVDYNNNIFRIVHKYDSKIIENENGDFIIS